MYSAIHEKSENKKIININKRTIKRRKTIDLDEIKIVELKITQLLFVTTGEI